MKGKNVFYEEAARTPLFMSFPGVIPAGKEVDAPVSHMDIMATILDYVRAKKLDKSDGRTLRRFIDGTSHNKFYDERHVVVEIDGRVPAGGGKLSRKLGSRPNYMIRKGTWKLMLPKKRDSKVIE